MRALQRLLTVMLVVILLMGSGNAVAQECRTLSPGGAETSSLQDGEPGDWWEIITTGDGSLTVTSVSDSTLDIDLYLYDTCDETNLVASGVVPGTNETVVCNNLMPGAYYIRAVCANDGGSGAYTISGEYVPASLDNDPEENDSPPTAIALSYDGIDTGHLGFRSLTRTDVNDFWSVQVPADGGLRVTTVSDSTLDVDLFIIGEDGETVIAGYDISTGIEEATHYDALTPGTYYVKAEIFDGTYGSYTISSEFTPTTRLSDHEPNGDIGDAAHAGNLVTRTGHLGHYDDGSIDTDDYFMVTVPIEWDTLYVHLVSDSTLDIDMIVYGGGGVTQIASGERRGTDEWVARTNLAEAVYYLRMNRYDGYGSYAFIISGSTAARPDHDPVVVETGDVMPGAFALSAPYPNPFNPSVAMTFSVPEDGAVRLTVYDMLGREIAVLADTRVAAGMHTAVWDGRDRFGNRAGAGVYLFRLQAGQFIETRRAVLVK